ncbi:MAG: MinD/ParA family protein, partial [Mycobacterium sp.]
MNRRGPDRGMLAQTVPLAGRPQGPPPRRRPPPQPVRPGPERGAVPQPRPDGPVYRPPSPADIRATVPVAYSPASVERQPGGAALDSLEDQDTQAPAKPGWRTLLARLTRIDLGPSKEQAYERNLQDRVRVPLGSAFPIAVLNLKGGVGKTAVVEALGSTFAEARDDRVIALDFDAGDLADRHGRRNARAHTHRNGSGLEVLGLPEYAQGQWRIEHDDVGKAFSLLRSHYSVVLVDCGKGLRSGVAEAVLAESRALVVVTNTSTHAVRKTKTT